MRVRAHAATRSEVAAPAGPSHEVSGPGDEGDDVRAAARRGPTRLWG